MVAIVSAERLGRRVKGRWLWRGLDLSLAPGDRVALRGRSGTGKTLLLRALALLDPIDEGRVLYDGAEVPSGNVPAYRSSVVYLQQRPAVLAGSVEANLARPFALAQNHHRGFDARRAASLCAALGMGDDFLAASADALSGGELQVVALARALLLEPRVLLLDEATASLDPARVARVEQRLAAWLDEAPGHACVWVSHSAEQLARVASRHIDLDEAVVAA